METSITELTTKYDPSKLTLEDIREALAAVREQPLHGQRSFIIHTGEGGRRAIDLAMKRMLANQDMEVCLERKLINEEEREGLQRMIDSADMDGIMMAMHILTCRLTGGCE